MLNKLLKKIITFILITAFAGRLILAPMAVLAQSAPPPPPSAPEAPAAPENNSTPPTAPTAPSAPSAPSGPSSPPSAPTAPSAPSAPTGPSSAPTGPSAPSSDPTQAPTTEPQPTAEVLPTGELLPTGETINPLDTSNPDTAGGSSSSGSSGSSSGSVNDPLNMLTGPGSYNYGAEIIDQKMETVNQNLAEIQNKIDAMTTTGFNFANFNTLSGEVISGNVEAMINLMNKLNSNISGLGTFSTLNLYGSYLGDIALQFTDGSPLSAFVQASDTVSKNAGTGPLSSNFAISDGDFTVKEANGNDAALTNDINLSADSGNNSASFNTGNGIVQTGDANALANIVNLVNTNINAAQWMFAVLNIFGELVGNIILPQEGSVADNPQGTASTVVGNENTGPGSTNYASATTNSTAEFENINNADIVSTLDVSANTGNNNASINTGGGYVSTGMADTSVVNTTVANTNTVNADDTVWLVIVNEMGKWVGHILGNPYGVNTASNSLPVSTQTSGAGDYTITSENSATGPLSTNVAVIDQNSQTSVSNINDAAITNNITADANTGNNQASYNTGAGVIETGDANTGVSLLNMANTNVTAKKFVVLFVNVIGNFLGDIIPTGQWEQAYNNSYYQGGSPLPTLAPLPTISPLEEEDPIAVGGVEEPFQNIDNSTDQQNLSQSSSNSYYYYYPAQYINSVKKVNSQRNRLTQLKNQYANISKTGEAETAGTATTLLRGTSVSTNFVKAVQSSGPAVLIGGLSLKVTNSWLLFVPLALFIYIFRRKNRINIDFNRYINMLLDIIL